MSTKKSNYMRTTIWTENMKIEQCGTIAACILESFPCIMAGKTKSAAELRALVLKLMQDKHEEMLAEGR